MWTLALIFFWRFARKDSTCSEAAMGQISAPPENSQGPPTTDASPSNEINNNEDAVITFIKDDISKCTDDGLNHYKSLMEELLQPKLPFKDSQLKVYHGKILEAVKTSLATTYDEILKNIPSTDLQQEIRKLVTAAQKNVEISINKQLNEVYLRKHEIQNGNFLKQIKMICTQAEAKYDEQAAQFQGTSEDELKAAHVEWEQEATKVFQEQLRHNGYQNMDFLLYEVKYRLQERLEFVLSEWADNNEVENSANVKSIEIEDSETNSAKKHTSITQPQDLIIDKSPGEALQPQDPMPDKSPGEEPLQQTEGRTAEHESPNDDAIERPVQKPEICEQKIDLLTMAAMQVPANDAGKFNTVVEPLISPEKVKKGKSVPTEEITVSRTTTPIAAHNSVKQDTIVNENYKPKIPPRITNRTASPSPDDHQTKIKTIQPQIISQEAESPEITSKTTVGSQDSIDIPEAANEHIGTRELRNENSVENHIPVTQPHDVTSVETSSPVQQQHDRATGHESPQENAAESPVKTSDIQESQNVPIKTELSQVPANRGVGQSKVVTVLDKVSTEKAVNNYTADRIAPHDPVQQHSASKVENDQPKTAPTPKNRTLSSSSSNEQPIETTQPQQQTPVVSQTGKSMELPHRRQTNPVSPKIPINKPRTAKEQTQVSPINTTTQDQGNIFPMNEELTSNEEKTASRNTPSKTVNILKKQEASKPVLNSELEQQSEKNKFLSSKPQQNSPTQNREAAASNLNPERSGIKSTEVARNSTVPVGEQENSASPRTKALNSKEETSASTGGRQRKGKEAAAPVVMEQKPDAVNQSFERTENEEQSETIPFAQRRAFFLKLEQTSVKKTAAPKKLQSTEKTNNIKLSKFEPVTTKANESQATSSLEPDISLEPQAQTLGMPNNVKQLTEKYAKNEHLAKSQSKSEKSAIKSASPKPPAREEPNLSVENHAKTQSKLHENKGNEINLTSQYLLNKQQTATLPGSPKVKAGIQGQFAVFERPDKGQTHFRQIATRTEKPGNDSKSTTKIESAQPASYNSVHRTTQIEQAKNSPSVKQGAQKLEEEPQRNHQLKQTQNPNSTPPKISIVGSAQTKTRPAGQVGGSDGNTSTTNKLKTNYGDPVFREIETPDIAVGIFCDKDSFQIGTYQTPTESSLQSSGKFKEFTCVSSEICFLSKAIVTGNKDQMYSRKENCFNIFDLIVSPIPSLQFRNKDTYCIHQVIAAFFDNIFNSFSATHNVKAKNIIFTTPAPLPNATKEVIQLSSRVAGYSHIQIVSTMLTAALSSFDKGQSLNSIQNLANKSTNILVIEYKEHSFAIGIVAVNSEEICVKRFCSSYEMVECQEEIFHKLHSSLYNDQKATPLMVEGVSTAYKNAFEKVLDNTTMPLNRISVSERKSPCIQAILDKISVPQCSWVSAADSSLKGASLLSSMVSSKPKLKIQDFNVPVAAQSTLPKISCFCTSVNPSEYKKLLEIFKFQMPKGRKEDSIANL